MVKTVIKLTKYGKKEMIGHIVGSRFGFITASATLLILVTSAFLEDRDLQSELGGYREYTRKISYRLIPLIW